MQRLVVRIEAGLRAHRIACEGELDFASYADLERAIHEAVRGRPSRVELDLRALTFMDSAGVRMIALAAQECRARGISFAVDLSLIGQRVLTSLGMEELAEPNDGPSADDPGVSDPPAPDPGGAPVG